MAYQTLSDRLTRLEEERKRVWDNINWTRVGLMAVIVVVLGVGGFLNTRINEISAVVEENRRAINELRLEFELESQADAEFRAQVLAWIAEQNARDAER